MKSAKSSIREGLLWLGSAALVGRLIDLVSLGVVLFFVNDRGLGEASLAWSVSTILEAVSGSGLGIGFAILQFPEIREAQRGSAFWFALASGSTIGLLLVLASPLVAELYGAPRLVPFLSIYGLRHVALGAACVPLQWLNRELRYRDVATAQTAGTMVAAIVRTAVAIRYGGAWALVVAHCSQAFVLLAAVFALSGFRPSRTFALAELRPFSTFSGHMVLAELTFQLFRNVDYVLVGYLLGMGPLGLYRIAFDVAMEVTVPLSELVNRSVTPVLARLESRTAEITEAFLYAARTLGLLLSPVVVALFAIVPDALTLLGSGRFLGAVDTARLLIVAASLRVVYQLFRPFLLATGRAANVLRLELLGLALLTTLLGGSLSLLGPTLGVKSAGLAWIAVYPCLLGTVLRVMKRLEGLAPGVFLGTVARGFASVPALALVAAAVVFAAPPTTPPALRLALVVTTVVATHLAYLRYVVGLEPGRLLARGD